MNHKFVHIPPVNFLHKFVSRGGSFKFQKLLYMKAMHILHISLACSQAAFISRIICLKCYPLISFFTHLKYQNESFCESSFCFYCYKSKESSKHRALGSRTTRIIGNIIFLPFLFFLQR